MADLNENMDKEKSAAGEMSQTLTENERINQNEYANRTDKSKFPTLIKM